MTARILTGQDALDALPRRRLAFAIRIALQFPGMALAEGAQTHA